MKFKPSTPKIIIALIVWPIFYNLVYSVFLSAAGLYKFSDAIIQMFSIMSLVWWIMSFIVIYVIWSLIQKKK